MTFQLGSFTWYKKRIVDPRSVVVRTFAMVLVLVLGRFHMQNTLSNRSFHRSVEEPAVTASANSQHLQLLIST